MPRILMTAVAAVAWPHAQGREMDTGPERPVLRGRSRLIWTPSRAAEERAPTRGRSGYGPRRT